ncbi:hypothetical protein JXX19_07490 [Ruthenibacterium lactatiformans]|nr:hypothetical protein [Ruthenibacterium lactatiformans]
MKIIVSLALAGLMSISALLPTLAAQETENVSIAGSSSISGSVVPDESVTSSSSSTEDESTAPESGSNAEADVSQKPLQLMRDIVHICVPGGRILDPFAGAGTTILAAVQEGYEAVGVEVTDAYYRLGGDRVRTALAAGDERTAEASNGEQGIQLDAQKR